MDNLWHLGDELRGQPKVVEDRQWSLMTSKLAEITKFKGERVNDLDYARMNTVPDVKQWDKMSYHHDESRMDHLNLGLMNLDLKMNDLKMNEAAMKNPFHNMSCNMNPMYPKGSNGNVNAFNMNVGVNKYLNTPNGKEANGKNNGGNSNGSNSNSNSNGNSNSNSAIDKRFKTLPTSEMLPRNEVLGGYVFVCNNDTMQEDLKRQLFGLPARYRDSVRAITPGLPLFLYNYTTHQLHGAASFGGSNIDPTAWEDKKCKGESRFPAQVRIRIRKLCKPLEEDSFRPVLHHYDGPKFRLELSIAETLSLLDLCEKEGI
ncbi:B2 protein-like isoform X2 [Phragmites australis]|uniref:B2 protein-like isoform X2 n=1 Tax=Phragmites australis TaxID=29695 RepID=UPI002D78D332|nr:B2 protein-like isoform X2 [Phragmites australis]